MASLDPGDLLAGQYRIERELASGGFGRTYLAHDTHLDDQVVIKELLEKWVKTPAIRQRFVYEAQALRRSKHDNVVIVYDLLTPESVSGLKDIYIVMEYMPGGSLEARMRKGLTWEDSVRIAVEVCKGLKQAHALGIVHRDIKPANILLSPDLSKVKISDFGVAHLPDRQQTSGSIHPGTLLYMSPELFRRTSDQTIDGRADLYALGVTLYQLLTGREYLSFDECVAKAERAMRHKFHLDPEVEPTFEQQIEWQLLIQTFWMDAACSEMPPDPRHHNPQIPADLAEVVMCTLAKEPDQRPASAEAMAEALSKVRLGRAPEMSTRVVSGVGWQVNQIIARSLDAARQRQLTAALELIQHAVSLAPHNARALAALANIQMLRGDFPAAGQAWLKVLELDTAYPELYSKLGQCYNRMGETGRAIAIQTQGLRQPGNRRNASLFHGLAVSFHAAGRLDEAVWALEQSLQIRPDPRLTPLLERWRAEAGQT